MVYSVTYEFLVIIAVSSKIFIQTITFEMIGRSDVFDFPNHFTDVGALDPSKPKGLQIQNLLGTIKKQGYKKVLLSNHIINNCFFCNYQNYESKWS